MCCKYKLKTTLLCPFWAGEKWGMGAMVNGHFINATCPQSPW